MRDRDRGGRLHPWCRHLAKWTNHTHPFQLWPIRFIMWKQDVSRKTGST